MMRQHALLKTGLALALCAGVGLGAPLCAHAQNDAPPPEAPPRRPPNDPNMTPEQRQQQEMQMRQRMQERHEQRLTRSLTALGITDQAQQNAVIEFSRAQDKARQPLRDMAQKLAGDVRDKDVTDAEIATELKDFHAAVAAEKMRSDQAAKDLDGVIGYSKNARLEATLMAEGVLGNDELAYAGGDMNGRGGMGGGPGGGGRGGRGRGGRGGGPGGPGGPGGGAPAPQPPPA